MFYKSTRNSNLKVDSAQAISQGISEDGGLFVPESIPSLTLDEVKHISGLSYSERAAYMMKAEKPTRFSLQKPLRRIWTDVNLP